MAFEKGLEKNDYAFGDPSVYLFNGSLQCHEV